MKTSEGWLPLFLRRLSRHDGIPKDTQLGRWWEKAACKDVPLEDRDRIFFPAKQHQELSVAYAEAHDYCRRCFVQQECLESAIEEEGRRAYGYRGDVDHQARRQLFYDRKHKSLTNNQRTSEESRNSHE